MSKRRKYRLRGRALAEKARRADALLVENERLQRQVNVERNLAGATRSEAMREVVQRLAENDGYREGLARYAIQESAKLMGEKLGQDVGRQIQDRDPIFRQKQKLRDAILRDAMAGTGVDAYAPAYSQEFMHIEFDIKPLRRRFAIG
jgi:hypothetical protein